MDTNKILTAVDKEEHRGDTEKNISTSLPDSNMGKTQISTLPPKWEWSNTGGIAIRVVGFEGGGYAGGE